MKYNVGDTLLLKVTVTIVDEKDERATYQSAESGYWFSDNDVFAVVSRAEPEPAKPAPKFKAGERVIHKEHPEWGAGTIETVEPGEYGTYKYRIDYPHKDSPYWYSYEGELYPAD